jgi:uncharacterized protein YacL
MGQVGFGQGSSSSSLTTAIENSSDKGGVRSSLPAAFSRSWGFWAARLLLIGSSSLMCYTFGPFGLHGLPAAGLGFLMAMVILLAELRMRRAEISGLAGGVAGGILGLLASLLLASVISRTAEPEATKSFLIFASLFALIYLGIVVGALKGRDWRGISSMQSAARIGENSPAMKLLDTSALIDGRIADICETHFLDGTLGVPRFVLHELQLVADSPDTLKRQRGRRGLEVLQRMQKMPGLEVRVLEEVPSAATVDQKLLELARETGSKIVTTDFNLNKVARVQGIAVLNVNELANAMKPAVLPGESMRVLILREGKEPTQGVAYLEDGTMVVVDGARRFINRTIDIVVTSMHQTPAGKMIFGRMDERAEAAARATAAGGNGQTQAPRATAHRFDPGSPAAYTGSDSQ